MAYDRKKLFEEAKQILSEGDVIFIEELAIELGINKSTFYDFWPIDSNEYHLLKRGIMKNKTKIKKELREGFKTGSPVEKIALYKLTASEDELRALNGQYMDHTSKGEKITITPLQFNNNAKSEDD